MLTLIFLIGLFYVFGNILIIGIKAAWGLTKLLFMVLFWPLILVIMVACGLIYIAIPVLAIIGLVSIFSKKSL